MYPNYQQPPAPQGYAPQQQYGAPAPQGAYGIPQQPPAAFVVPQFVSPQIGTGDPTPSVRHLAGRACAFFNVKIGMGTKYGTQDQIEQATFDVLIAEGGPLAWGDDITKTLPPVLAVDRTPFEISGCLHSGGALKALKQIAGNPAAVLIGRVVRGTQSSKGQPPWLITPLGSDLDPYAAHAATVVEMVQALVTRRFTEGRPAADNPVPAPINGGPRKTTQQPAPAPQQQYAPQPAYAPAPPPGAYAPSMMQPAPQQQYATPAGVVQYAVPVQPAQQQPASPGAPLDAEGQQIPAGWPAELWAKLTPDQRAQMRG
jgi:hypothetical protein